MQIKKSISFLFIVFIFHMPIINAQQSQVYTITPDGFGPVHVGMTVKQAEKALGVKMVLADDGKPNKECYHLHPINNAYGGVYFMIRNWRVSRASIMSGSTIKTNIGIGILDSEEKVLKIYGNSLQISPNEYGDKGDHYLTYWTTPKRNRGIRFETYGGKVMDIHAGDASIQLIEGCS